MSNLNNAISQHIDSSGKSRILNFKRVSIAVSPLPILNIPEVPKSDTIFATLKDALDFIAKTSLTIVQRDVENGILRGLWVMDKRANPSIAFGYIPTIENEEYNNDPLLRNIEESVESLIDPIFVEDKSYLNEARANEKVADMLKEYALYEWSQNPEKFGENNFVIREGYTSIDYGISPTVNTQSFNLRERNKRFYKGSKLIVPNKETLHALLSYVRVASLNDSHLQDYYKRKLLMNQSPFYKSITDFKPSRDQHIFVGKGSLVSWLAHHPLDEMGKDMNVVKNRLSENTSEPYYYRNVSIQNGRLVIIQNTRNGDLRSALTVSKEWVLTGTNIGYDLKNYVTNDNSDNVPFEVYTSDGLTHRSDKSGKDYFSVLGYDSGSYAAMLFL
jgi:hypothetical protein